MHVYCTVHLKIMYIYFLLFICLFNRGQYTLNVQKKRNVSNFAKNVSFSSVAPRHVDVKYRENYLVGLTVTKIVFL